MKKGAKSSAKRLDTLTGCWKICIRSFGEKCSLNQVALEEGLVYFEFTAVLHHVPSEFEIYISILSQFKPGPLVGGAFGQGIGFRDEAQGTLSSGINSSAVLKNDLVCIAVTVSLSPHS